MKQKHILTLTLLCILIFMVGISYMLFGRYGIISGVCDALMIVSLLDKDISYRKISEFLSIFLLQVFILILTLFARINLISLIIVSFIAGLIINNIHITYKKSPRTQGFFYLYMFIIYLKVPFNVYPKLIFSLALSSFLILVMYYLLTRKIYFKKAKDTIKGTIKADIDDIEFMLFKQFKFRFNILSSILFTIAIFTMVYFYEYHGLWLAITILVVLIPDKDLSIKKLINRTIGTLIGSGLFILISFILNNNPYSLYIYIGIILITIYFCIYPMKYYYIQAIFITLFALTVDSFFYKQQTHLFLGYYRIIFTILGCLLIFLLFVIEPYIEKLFKLRKD
ncbi:MAG: FUSC family protein [Clostridium sp.]|uniref:FUSC family protein n=1 Tax=Clostridium sp. TaxID=1506 RepID=UPI003EE802D5